MVGIRLAGSGKPGTIPGMRLPQAWQLAVLPCVAAATLAACSGPASHPSDAEGPARTGSTASSGAADSRLSVVTFAGTSPLSAEALRRTTDRLRERAKALGLRGVRVETRDGSVSVTGPASGEARMRELGAAGRLGFRPVLAEEAVGPSQPSASTDPARGRAVTEDLRPRAAGSSSASAAPDPDPQDAPSAALQQQFVALDCSGHRAHPAWDQDNRPQDPVVACSADSAPADQRSKYLLGPTAVDGSHVASAKALRDKRYGNWIVRLGFDSVATRKFSDLTGDLAVNASPQNQFAIVLDGAVLSAPYVNQRLSGGTADVSGGFNRQSAEQLAVTLNSGTLPVPLNVTSVTPLPHT
jgi:preprotein translocase subunit SecD